MGQYHRVAVRERMRNAVDIGAMRCRIVESHNAEFASCKGDDDRLINQQMQFVTV